MKISKITQVLALAGASIAIPNTSQAALIFELKEVGSDVVLTMLAGGSLDMTGLLPMGGSSVVNGGAFTPSDTQFSVGSGAYTRFGYFALPSYTLTRFHGPLSFGTGGFIAAPDSVSGDLFAFDNKPLPGEIYVSSNYVSGTTITNASSATYQNKTLSQLGATVGTYVWTLPNDTITLRVGSASTVPDAGGSVAGLGLAVAGLIHLRRRRQNTVTA